MTHHVDLSKITLSEGSHDDPDEGLCVMEAVAYFAGMSHTDHPICVSETLGYLLRPWNDALDVETRQRLKAFIPRLVGTAGNYVLEDRRKEMVWDWVLTDYLPRRLRLARLDDAAEAVIAHRENGLSQARQAAAAACLAADDLSIITDLNITAWDTTRTAMMEGVIAWEKDSGFSAALSSSFGIRQSSATVVADKDHLESAWTAAWRIARDATLVAALNAAKDDESIAAAWALAISAASEEDETIDDEEMNDSMAAIKETIMPTVRELQESMFALIDRLIDVKDAKVE